LTVTLKLPRLTMNMNEATLVRWRKAPGDSFKQGEILYEIETEKVTSEVEAPGDGRLVEILAPEGAELEVGDPVCRVEGG
jgi:pyruvate/2-oxoglutarate dehydrogenase complex dihydrolipoamide acyltransferase (E2) component